MSRHTVSVEIDVQKAYDEMSYAEQKDFLRDNIGDLSDDDIIQELLNRGYEEPEKA